MALLSVLVMKGLLLNLSTFSLMEQVYEEHYWKCFEMENSSG